MKNSMAINWRGTLTALVSVVALTCANSALGEDAADTTNQSVPSTEQRDHNINQPSPFADDPVERDRQSSTRWDSEEDANTVDSAADPDSADSGRRGIVYKHPEEGQSLVLISTGDNQVGAVAIDSLINRRVVNQQGQELGRVQSVVQPRSGEVAAVVLEVGGFLGLGEKEIAAPLDEVRVAGQQLIWETNLDKSQLKKSETYHYEEDRFSALSDE
jgi:sporulation protein YlmC with PRC-barrel domain